MYALLREQLAQDFPYLNLKELREIILLGIKGKLDKYKSAPMNFTRLYQWVDQRAIYTLSYWKHKYPEATHWATYLFTDAGVLARLHALPDLTKINQSLYHTNIRGWAEKEFKFYYTLLPALTAEEDLKQKQIRSDFSAWQRRYPEYATLHANQLLP